MILAAIAAHPACPPALLTALAQSSAPTVAVAAIANPALPDDVLVPLLNATPRSHVRLCAAARRPTAHLLLADQDVDALQVARRSVRRHDRAEAALVSALADAVLRGMSGVGRVRVHELLLSPGLTPDRRLALLEHAAAHARPLPTDAISFCYAATKHPDRVADLAARTRYGPFQREMTVTAAVVGDAVRDGPDPTTRYVDHLARTYPDQLGQLVTRTADAELADRAIAGAAEDVTRTDELPALVRLRAATTLPPGIPRAKGWLGVVRDDSDLAGAVLVHATVNDVRLLARDLMRSTTLTVDELTVIFDASTTTANTSHPRPGAGAWLATHPNATPAQRAQGRAAAVGGDPVCAAVAAVSMHLPHAPAAAAADLPVQSGPASTARIAGQLNTGHLARTYLDTVLADAVRTPAGAAAFTVLAPTFPGTLGELVAATVAVAS